MVEYGFKKILFSGRSKFQDVLVVDTVDFGALLVLDGMTNLAESDTYGYTHALMNLPNEDYKA